MVYGLKSSGLLSPQGPFRPSGGGRNIHTMFPGVVDAESWALLREGLELRSNMGAASHNAVESLGQRVQIEMSCKHSIHSRFRRLSEKNKVK